MRVVLDTNVIVSSFLVALGAPARIVAAWRRGRFQLVVFPALLIEYEEALGYERVRQRHQMTPEQIAIEVENIQRIAMLVEPREVPAVVARDRDDDQVLACAVAGAADYIVSGDAALLELREYRSIRILSPAALVALLDREN
jgi:putative PIN family toxin of toxin-antitoxin system